MEIHNHYMPNMGYSGSQITHFCNTLIFAQLAREKEGGKCFIGAASNLLFHPYNRLQIFVKFPPKLICETKQATFLMALEQGRIQNFEMGGGGGGEFL